MKRAFVKVFTGPPSLTSLRVVAGFVLLVTLVGVGLSYFQTRQLIAESEATDRSREAISLIGTASQLVERIEYQTALHQATKHGPYLEEARRSGIKIQATLTHLHSLPYGNTEASSQLENLNSGIAIIDQQLNQDSIPYDLLQAELEKSKRILGSMAEQEQHLLDGYSQRTQRASFVLLRGELSVLCLTFLLGVIFTGVFMRDLLAHKEAQKLQVANLAALRRQGKELRTFQTSMDEHRLTAILQTISQSVANDLVAHSQVKNDAPPATNSSQGSILVPEQKVQTKKILIVDDDPQIRTLLAARLKHYGYLVVTAPDVSSALTIASEEVPDLVILDLCLPDGDGFLFMERMKEIPALDCTPIVMLSGSDLDDYSQYTLKILSVSFFQKGQPNRDFLKVIKQALEERKLLPSAFFST